MQKYCSILEDNDTEVSRLWLINHYTLINLLFIVCIIFTLLSIFNLCLSFISLDISFSLSTKRLNSNLVSSFAIQ